MTDVAQIIARLDGELKRNQHVWHLERDDLRALLDEVKRAQSERDDFLENIDQLRKSVEWTKSQEALKLHNDLLARAEAAEAELARLREPAGEVGEAVAELRMWSSQTPFYEEAQSAAELLTRQAAEIADHEEASARLIRASEAMKAEFDGLRSRATTAEARLREAVEVIRQLRLHVPHNSVTAERARAFLSTLETTNE